MRWRAYAGTITAATPGARSLWWISSPPAARRAASLSAARGAGKASPAASRPLRPQAGTAMKTANVRCAARHSRARAQAKAPRPPRRRSPTPKRAYKNTARQSGHMRPGPVRPGRVFCCRFSATTSPRCTVERKRAFAAGSGRSGIVFNPQKMQRAAGRTPFAGAGPLPHRGAPCA